MNDSQFDDFVNDRLKEYAAPVPAGLWEKVAEGQFDQFIGSKLKNTEAPVPEGLWDKIAGPIADNQFDNFIADKFDATKAPVPSGLWDKIADGQFDSFVAGKLDGTEAAIPTGLWDKITDGQFDGFVAGKLGGAEAIVPTDLWDKITDNQFDNFVAGKLRDHEAPVPAGLWKKVRPEEDDDKVGFFWFRYPAAAVLLLGILTAAAWGGYTYFSKKNTAVEVAAPASPKTNGANDEPKTPAQESPKASDNAATVPSTATPGTNAPVSNTTTPLTNSAEPKTNTPVIPGNKTNLTPGNNVSNNKSVIDKNNDRLNGATIVPERSSQKENTVNNKPSGNRLAPPPANNDVSNNAYDLFKNKNGVITGKENDQTITSTDDNITLESFHHSFTPANTIAFSLNNYKTLADKQLSTLNHTNQFKSVIICPGDKKGNRDWMVEVYGSPDIALKSVSNVSASSLYLLKKDSSESSQIGFTAGVRIVKPITDNILLKAGLQYTQANQKYVYRTENEVKTTTVVTVRSIIRAPGDTVIVHDTSTLQTIGFKNNTVINHYRTLDIPITIGYQSGTPDDDLRFGVNAGAVLNLSSWYEGVILDSSLATVTLNKTGNQVYKTKVGLGLYAGLSIVKRLGDDMHAFVEPYFRYNLSDMTTPQASFKQKLNFVGVSFGLRFNLNRK